MELQNSREYKAAQELERALNDMGWSPKRFAESTRFYHRTLQQELMRTIVAVSYTHLTLPTSDLV